MTAKQKLPSAGALDTKNLKVLRSEYARVYGLTTTSSNKDYLRKRIAARRAELALERTTRRLEAAPERARDPRLPAAGTVLEREHDGKTYKVKVLEHGFEYARQTFTSLSSVAKAITGTNWNGFGFFGLGSATNEGARS
jgi:hypothetical protein